MFRCKTKFGMANFHNSNDPAFVRVVFDKPVALNDRLKTAEWLINKETVEKKLGVKVKV